MENSRETFRERNLEKWEQKILEVFQKEVPMRYEWESIDEIIKVLNIIGGENLNHNLLPTGGDLDLTGADFAIEEGCIKIFSGSTYDIIKPKRLIFNSFGEDYEWSYFRLETSELKQSDIYEYDLDGREELTCLKNGKYLDRKYWDMGFYYDQYGEMKEFSLEDTVVVRYFKSASFAIFAKMSIYNKTDSAYDGIHNKMNDEEFRNYVQNIMGFVKNKQKA